MARGKKPLLENIEIKKIAAEGKSIAYVDEKVLFVPNTVPGDIVDVQVTRKRKSFLEGFIVNVRKYSDIRTEPFCSHFGNMWRMQMAKPALSIADRIQTTGNHRQPAKNR